MSLSVLKASIPVIPLEELYGVVKMKRACTDSTHAHVCISLLHGYKVAIQRSAHLVVYIHQLK